MSGFQLQRLGLLMEPEPGNPLEVGGVLNPAVIRGPNDALYLFPRMVSQGELSRIGIARVKFNDAGDPAGVERLGLALEPEADYEMRPDGSGGCEDPRITFVDPLRSYLMTYTAFSSIGPRIALAISKDLFHWKRLGLATFAPFQGIDFAHVDNKDACLFPIAIPNHVGKLQMAILHRPLFPGTRPEDIASEAEPRLVDLDHESIWISYCPMPLDGVEPMQVGLFNSHQRLASPVSPWELLKIGGGTPPIMTRHGWLIFYHGVSEMKEPASGTRHFGYSAGAMVLSKEHPQLILYRSEEPVLIPLLQKERFGTVDNVVFPTGIDRRDDLGTPDRFDIYYGMADRRIGVARLDLPEQLPLDHLADDRDRKLVGSGLNHQQLHSACWLATVFVLGFACLACRNPDQESPKPAAPVIQPRIAMATKGIPTLQAPVGSLTGQSLPAPFTTAAAKNASAAAVKEPTAPVDKSHKDPSAPATTEGKVLTGTPSKPVALGAHGAAAVPATTRSPSDLAASVLVAKGETDLKASGITSGRGVVAPTSPTQVAPATEGSGALRTPVELPMDSTALTQAAKSVGVWSGPVAMDGRVVVQARPTQGSEATKGPEGASTISSNPADQAALALVARTDKDWRVRMAAVGGLILQDVLAEIAMADDDVDVRKLAVSRLRDQAALARVATLDKDWSVRGTAVAMVTHQGVLASIALLDEDSDIRRLAVSRLTGQAALARVARGDKDWSVRNSAVNKLTNRAVLAQIATRDPDRDVRQLAVGKLKHTAATP